MLLWCFLYSICFSEWLYELIQGGNNLFIFNKHTHTMFLESIILLYFILGTYFVVINSIPETYLMITMYLCFKWIFNYRKCTLSYYEVKLRGIKKEEGYLYRFLERLVDFRNNQLFIYPMLLFQIVIIFLYYYRA